MASATRLPTDMSGWAPTTRHYQVDGGHLAVTVNTFLTATGTDIFYADADGVAMSLTPLVQLPDGTGHTEALASLGYTVVDDLDGDPDTEPAAEPETPTTPPAEPELPPEIAAMIPTPPPQEGN